MSFYLGKLPLQSTTTISLDDRFTKLRKVQQIKSKQNNARNSRQGTKRNQNLAASMGNRPNVAAALTKVSRIPKNIPGKFQGVTTVPNARISVKQRLSVPVGEARKKNALQKFQNAKQGGNDEKKSIKQRLNAKKRLTIPKKNFTQILDGKKSRIGSQADFRVSGNRNFTNKAIVGGNLNNRISNKNFSDRNKTTLRKNFNNMNNKNKGTFNTNVRKNFTPMNNRNNFNRINTNNNNRKANQKFPGRNRKGFKKTESYE